MLQIQNHQTVVPDEQARRALRKAFRAQCYVHLPGLLETSLLESVWKLMEDSQFDERLTPNIGCVQCCTDPRIDNGFTTLLNQPEVLETVADIVTQPLHLWGGNTVRRIPGQNHFSAWHNDKSPPVAGADGKHYQRVVPLSLNISLGPFDGGHLEMRRLPEKTIIADIPNPTPGDAVLFAIGNNLQHRVADVTGGCPRMVHVGWFHQRIG